MGCVIGEIYKLYYKLAIHKFLELDYNINSIYIYLSINLLKHTMPTQTDHERSEWRDYYAKLPVCTPLYCYNDINLNPELNLAYP